MSTKVQSFSRISFPSVPKLYGTGEMLEKSNVSVSTEIMGKEDTKLAMYTGTWGLIYPIITQTNTLSSTPVYPRPNKRKISCVNETNSSNVTPVMTKSSRMLGLVSTLTGKASSPFWNSSTREWSTKLWSCTETGLRELESRYWTGYLKNLASNSWFTVKVKTMMKEKMTNSSQSSPFLLQAIMENEQRLIKEGEQKEKVKKENARMKKKQKVLEHNEIVDKGWTNEDKAKLETSKKMKDELEYEKKNKTRCAKKIANELIRVKNDIMKLEKKYTYTRLSGEKEDTPMVSKNYRSKRMKVSCNTKESKDKLMAWINATRWVYNRCVEYSVNNPDIFKVTSDIRLRMLRDNISKLKETNTWLDGVPYDVYDEGVRDFQKAYSSNMTKMKKMKSAGKDFRFKIGFRSKKYTIRETITIQRKHWNRGAQRFLVEDFTSNEGAIPAVVEAAVKITITRMGFYYSILSSVDINTNKYTQHDVVALDPGVRTFMTGYFSNGMVIEWGAGDMSRIYALNRFADKLYSKYKKGGKKYRRPWLKLLLKIRYKIDEIHKKLATFLCRSSRVILLPKFDTSKMVKRSTRNISRHTARNMMNFAHYRFRETLINKASLFSGCKVIICDEHYTSKTCGSCGELHDNLGRNKVFKCPICLYTSDRDINAARNILLRFLTLEGIKPSSRGH